MWISWPGMQMMDDAVHHDIDLSFQYEEIFLHHVVVVSPEILPGHKLHQGKIHAGALHQIFGAAVSKAVFPVFSSTIYIGHFSFS